jgi:DNA polymerase elongation subunit (family B)
MVIRDSFKLLPSSLDSLCKSFLNKDKMVVDYSVLTDYSNYSKMKDVLGVSIMDYNLSDVYNLRDILLIFRKKLAKDDNLEMLSCMTLASLTFINYRRDYMPEHKIMNDSKDKNKYSFIRKAYKGGIVDVYKPVGHNMTALDINSLYPSRMYSCDMPVGVGQ